MDGINIEVMESHGRAVHGFSTDNDIDPYYARLLRRWGCRYVDTLCFIDSLFLFNVIDFLLHLLFRFDVVIFFP